MEEQQERPGREKEKIPSWSQDTARDHPGSLDPPGTLDHPRPQDHPKSQDPHRPQEWDKQLTGEFPPSASFQQDPQLHPNSSRADPTGSRWPWDKSCWPEGPWACVPQGGISLSRGCEHWVFPCGISMSWDGMERKHRGFSMWDFDGMGRDGTGTWGVSMWDLPVLGLFPCGISLSQGCELRVSPGFPPPHPRSLCPCSAPGPAVPAAAGCRAGAEPAPGGRGQPGEQAGRAGTAPRAGGALAQSCGCGHVPELCLCP